MSPLPEENPLHSHIPAHAGLPTRNGWFHRNNLIRRVCEFIYDFLIGPTLSWVLAPYQICKRKELEHLSALVFSTQMVGMPLLPPHERLRLLPYRMPSLMHWRRMTIFDRAMEGANLRYPGR